MMFRSSTIHFVEDRRTDRQTTVSKYHANSSTIG